MEKSVFEARLNDIILPTILMQIKKYIVVLDPAELKNFFAKNRSRELSSLCNKIIAASDTIFTKEKVYFYEGDPIFVIKDYATLQEDLDALEKAFVSEVVLTVDLARQNYLEKALTNAVILFSLFYQAPYLCEAYKIRQFLGSLIERKVLV